MHTGSKCRPTISLVCECRNFFFSSVLSILLYVCKSHGFEDPKNVDSTLFGDGATESTSLSLVYLITVYIFEF